MRIKLICCDVFLRPVSAFVAISPHTIDVEYVPMLAHNEPDKLRNELQTRINTAACLRNYDLFILAYGLCGNAALGLTCPVKMVMPRIHDCCAMFMGSKEDFANTFENNLSMRWCTSGYYERCYLENGLMGDNRPKETYPEYQALIEQFGEDNAEYIWETMHPEIETPEAAYIKTPEFEIPGHEDGFRKQVEEQGKTVKILEGSTAFLNSLINGPWDDKRFLTLNPGEKIGGVYDMDEVIKAVPV